MTKLLIFIIIFLLFIRIVNSLFKGIYKMTGHDPRERKNKYYQKNYRKQGEIKIDKMPNNKEDKFGNDYKGGEYIDYEELK